MQALTKKAHKHLKFADLSEKRCCVRPSVKDRSVWIDGRLGTLFKLALGIVLLASTNVFASAIHPVEDIKATAIAFVAAQSNQDASIETQVLALDRRLRLAKCDRPLSGFWPTAARRQGVSSIGVRCEGTRRWKLYVPVRIAQRKKVLVATRTMTRGEPLQGGDLIAETRDVGRLRQGYLDPQFDYVGHRLARTLRAGSVISRRALLAPRLVSRGQKVSVAVGGQNWQIQMDGVALEEGGLGSIIRVRNSKTKRIVRGEVVAPARIRVTF